MKFFHVYRVPVPARPISAALGRIVGCCILIAAFSLSPCALAQGVPEKIQAAIYYKLLNYDRSLEVQTGHQIVIGIVIDESTARIKSDLAAAFRLIQGKRIQNRTVHFTLIRFANRLQFQVAVQAENATVLYLANGSKPETIDAVADLANAEKIPILAGNERMARNSAAVGLTVENGKPKLVVNLPVSKRQGMKLSARVLQLAKVLR